MLTDPWKPARIRVEKQMTELGAVSPEAARPVSELPIEVKQRLEFWVRRGVLRESAGKRYYVFVSSELSAPRKFLLALLFWLLVLLVPMLILLFG